MHLVMKTHEVQRETKCRDHTSKRSLTNLPVEILHHIAGFLPPSSLVSFLLSCRTVYDCCIDSQVVWQRSVKENSGFTFSCLPPKVDINDLKELALLDLKTLERIGHKLSLL